MAEASVATPGSPAESGTPAKTPAAKDKSCPFCNQTFTSSSLGRHLDLYIKEKNPKPPDGVHNADEIRQLRGNVTRRQARNSSSKREGSTPSSARPSALRDQRSPSVGRHYHNGDQPRKEKVILRLNEANWQATGVINNIPSTPRDGLTRHDPRRDGSRRTSVKHNFVRRHEGLDERDNGRAAELALKEVLGSIRAANAQVNRPSPFEFDLLSLTFPAMCLQCLSAPPTLFSSQPIPTTRSWSVEPPGPTQLESLQRWLESKLQNWRQRTRALALEKQHQMNGTNGHMAHKQLSTEAEEEARYTTHLHTAFQAWKALPDKQKHETWRTETLRAYAREQQTRHESETRLQRLSQEAQHLRAQVAQLSKCQQPREFVLFPPSTLPLPADILASARTSDPGFEPADWDFDRLVAKWKARIRQRELGGEGLAGQLPLPAAAGVKSWNFSAGGAGGGLGDRAPMTGGGYPGGGNAHPMRAGGGDADADCDGGFEEEGADMEDALGEEEEEEEEANGGADGEGGSGMGRGGGGGVLDPSLRGEGKGGGGGEEEVMEGIEGDGDGGEGYGAGGLLGMGLREYGVNGGVG